MKKWLARIIVVSLMLVPALVLFGCGNGEGASGAGTQEGLFKGREARDMSEAEQYVEKALELAEERRAFDQEGKSEAVLTEEVAEDFQKANALYEEGDYDQAQKDYEAILQTYPQHYGANVNLTLAMLRQEKNEEALVQALCSLSLFPKDDGIPLNVQTAAVACGFTADYALEVSAEVISESDGGFAVSDKYARELEYNRVWDRIETEMWKAAHSEGSEEQNREAYEALHEELMEEVEGEFSDDKDAHALLAYLEAVGEQLGLTTQEQESDEVEQDASAEAASEDKDAEEENHAEDKAAPEDKVTNEGKASEDSKEDKSTKDDKDGDAAKEDKAAEDAAAKQEKPATDAKEPSFDFSSVEPHVGLPYVVLDDELCTIIFTGYHMATDNPVAEFSMLNKTSDKRLRMEAADARANGIDIENFSGAYVYVDPGEQATGWGCFFGMDGDDVISLVEGELEELTCVISVADVTGYSHEELGTYPLSWKADESGAGQRSIERKDQKKAIDEDVFSLTVTGVRGASDDVVGIEYSSGYKGEGNISFDSVDDWKVNGVDMELLGTSMPFDNMNGWFHVLVLKAKNPGALGNQPVKTVEGTIVVKDADGNELASGKIELP